MLLILFGNMAIETEALVLLVYAFVAVAIILTGINQFKKLKAELFPKKEVKKENEQTENESVRPRSTEKSYCVVCGRNIHICNYCKRCNKCSSCGKHH